MSGSHSGNWKAGTQNSAHSDRQFFGNLQAGSNVSQKMEAKNGAAEAVADGLVAINGWLWEKFAKAQDEVDVRALAKEIDAAIHHEGGVLIARYVVKKPTFNAESSEYAGLMVVGYGYSEPEARLALARRRAPPAAQTSTVCTADNPTGRRQVASATLSAPPEGRNHGYASHVAAKILKVLEKNPSNTAGGGLVRFAHVEEQLFFISASEWKQRKQAAKGAY